jgi:uncharacterized protein (DUF427 family)
MSKSPGHAAHPEHEVRETPVDEAMKVRAGDETLAESDDVVKVAETGAPLRYYFPRADVRMTLLTPSATTSECPFKGHATYFDLTLDTGTLKDAVWTYEHPYDEHEGLAQRLCFYDDKYRQIGVHVAD